MTTQKLNRNPANRVRFGKGEQLHERALTFEKSRSKRHKACSDMVDLNGVEPSSLSDANGFGNFFWRFLTLSTPIVVKSETL